MTDYWDTAFLDSALKSLQRRKAGLVLEKLVLLPFLMSKYDIVVCLQFNKSRIVLSSSETT